jgi:hypothetical protein
MDKITLIIILLLLWVSFLITNIFNTIDPIIIQSGKPGPVVLMVGGTHGNEPAGTVGLEKLINSNIKISKGMIIIVPKVNKIGLSLGIRLGFNGFLPIDYNRNYPLELKQIKPNKPYYNINEQIQLLVDKADFVLDFHEGWNFHRVEPTSLGSGLYSSNTPLSKSFSLDIINELNKTISEDKKKFVCGDTHKDIDGTLNYYCKQINKNYILVETTGQNNTQPLDLRVGQVLFIIDMLLNKLDMK